MQCGAGLQLQFMPHRVEVGEEKKNHIRTRTRAPADTHTQPQISCRVCIQLLHLPSHQAIQGEAVQKAQWLLCSSSPWERSKRSTVLKKKKKKEGEGVIFFFFLFKIMRSSRIRRAMVLTASGATGVLLLGTTVRSCLSLLSWLNTTYPGSMRS